MPVQYKLDQNVNLIFDRKQSFVIFNDCKDMLQNFDEIIRQPFPIKGVFNRRLTNIEGCLAFF